jgi:chromosome segregation ATPase
VTSLNAQIAKAQKEIDAKNNQIKQLSSQISTKNKVIGELTGRLDKNKESLASILRQEQALDDYSIVEVAFAAEDLSSFFSDVDSFMAIKHEMSSLFTSIKSTKAQTEEEKAARQESPMLSTK